jgi:hypothetical protein
MDSVVSSRNNSREPSQLFEKRQRSNLEIFLDNKNKTLTTNQSNAKKKKALRVVLKEAFETPWFKSIVKIIYSPHIILKLFLFIFGLSAFSYASYLVIESIMTYFNYEVRHKITHHTRDAHSFPKSTILQHKSVYKRVRF